jgi:hypothetical protein
MAAPVTELDAQIERLRKGDTLLENEVKQLCEKVSNGRRRGLCFQVVGPCLLEATLNRRRCDAQVKEARFRRRGGVTGHGRMTRSS